MRRLGSAAGREEGDASGGKSSALVAVVSEARYYAAAGLNVESQACILVPSS